ncbi:MAG: RdgB/HAM1 family non-canonical purine NTP pyrophosphatase [bacterium]
MDIVLATGNKHKVKEIKKILEPLGCRFFTLEDLPVSISVKEDGKTFRENAYKKGVTVAKAGGLTALADDSGLEVDFLAGAPGIYSARYAHGRATDAENNARLLVEMEGAKSRSARFRCVIALVDPRGGVRYAEGTCEGVIAERLSGNAGFGYDPLFIPAGYDKTMSELGPKIKNRISHRAQALSYLSRLIFDG